MSERTKFPGLSREAFVSELDHKALRTLQGIPLLPKVVEKFYEAGLDRWMYVYNMGRSVRCGPKQFGTLYEMMRESCAVLDMPEPELYVSNNPFTNAFAGGVERPYIVVRSSMIDALNDEELYHLIGHELGHIKAGHILYFSIGMLLAPLLELIGRRTLGLGDAASLGLAMAFAEWSRQAEISADRAGLLVAQSLDTSLDANMKLCAGGTRLAHEMSRDAFMEQARTYQNTDTLDTIGKMIWFYLLNWNSSHPMFVHRAQQLEKWVVGGSYDRILSGDYPRQKAA